MRGLGEKASKGISAVGDRASEFLEDRPNAQSMVKEGQGSATKAAEAVVKGVKKTAELIPEGVTDWGHQAVVSVRRSVGTLSRVGLSSRRVVARHQKRGHEVAELADLRDLDLKQIDLVRGRGARWYYPAFAALFGAGASFVITGGELAVPASGGVAAAPSAGLIAGAVVADATLVLGLASRSVGQVAFHYGYDPEEPAEKLFVMSVVNAGTALSATAKTAAMADVSRLTQALVRGKVWKILDKSLVSQVSKQFAKAFGVRLTKQSLGKVVPMVGIVIGGTLNWVALEGVVDSANVAYRRRFLLEKYPSLQEDEVTMPVQEEANEDQDEIISVLQEIRDAGGPDLGP